MALNGNETLEVRGQNPTGVPASSTFTTTTGAIAQLATSTSAVVVRRVNLTNQTAAIAATTAYTTLTAGIYRISYVASITTPGTVTSTLGGSTGFQAKYTDVNDSVVKTMNPGGLLTSTANTTATSLASSGVVYAAVATPIQYIMGYTSNVNMAYDLNIVVESL